MRRRWSSLFFLAGLASMAVAGSAALGRAGADALPALPALAAAAVALTAGLSAAAAGWISLLSGTAPRSALAHGFALSQLGKYIPGGIWLGVGQVGTAVAAGVPPARAGGALAAFGLCFVVAAGTAAGASAALGAAGVTRHGLVAIGGLALPLLLHRRWMSAATLAVTRRLRKSAGAAIVPSQRRILCATGCSLVSVCGSAVAFAVLLGSLDPAIEPAAAASAFTVAWLAGYLALGLPSGIGAREAVLVALLPAGASTILAASLAQRIVQMALEATLAVATRVPLLRARRSTPAPTLEVPRA